MMFFFCGSRFVVTILGMATLLARSTAQECSFLALIVDESGSMSGEQSFIRDTAMEPLIDALELELEQQVIVCSYGYSAVSLGARNLGCSVGFDSGDYSFSTSGGTEDGFRAIHEANAHAKALTDVEGFSLSTCDTMTRFMILITDEDRDDTNSSITFDNTLQLLGDEDWYLHAILNQNLIPSEAVGAFNETADSSWAVYTPNTDPAATSRYIETSVTVNPIGVGEGDTAVHYVPLAFQRQGAVWNLNTLRAGGVPAEAFTQAFIEITRELIEEAIVEPPLCPEGLLGLLACPFILIWEFLVRVWEALF